MARAKTPVTLVTGYLGSGKTTLVNRLLSEAASRTAVIVNEFGAVGIDGILIQNMGGADKVVELANGCICCVVTGEFRQALEALPLDRLDHIIIETSGAADPTSIIKMFWGAPELTAKFRLDAVVCLVDARGFLETVRRDSIALLQASVADVQLVSKVDAVSKERREDVCRALRQINPMASLLEFDFTSGQTLPRGALVGINAYRGARPVRFLREMSEGTVSHGGLTSLAVSWAGQVPAKDLQIFFRELALSDAVVRTKALIRVQGEEHSWLIQGVQAWIERTVAPKSYLGPNRLVVLGRDLGATGLGAAIERLRGATVQL